MTVAYGIVLNKLNQNERRVLLRMLDGWRCDSNVVTFGLLSEELGISRTAAKRACRRLASFGLAEHSPYWCESDGLLGGSGYTLSCAGFTEVKFNEEALKKRIEEYVPRNTVQKLRRERAGVPQQILCEAESPPSPANDVLNVGVGGWGEPHEREYEPAPKRIPNTLHDGTYFDPQRDWHERFDRPATRSWWQRLVDRFWNGLNSGI